MRPLWRSHDAPDGKSRYEFALAFAPMKADLVERARILLKVKAAEAVLWFAYPKQTSRQYRSDLNREGCWEALKPLKLQPVRQIAIDDDWSALRFKRLP